MANDLMIVTDRHKVCVCQPVSYENEMNEKDRFGLRKTRFYA